ncbi:MAG: hypothetical protein RQ715_08300 [Methylococcales bacterium]|nr:hypothetical protein [Methylococcales bacterium]
MKIPITMTDLPSPLEQWLQELEPSFAEQAEQWDPGFAPGQQVVVRKIGRFKRRFPRPSRFRARWFDRVIILPIDTWRLNWQAPLFSSYCTLSCALTLHVQATLSYLNRHDIDQDVGPHIQQHYAQLLETQWLQILQQLERGDWLEHGLAAAEQQMVSQVNETLLLQDILARSNCQITAEFAELDEQAITKLPTYQHRSLLTRHLQLKTQRQQEWLAQQELEHKQAAERKLQHLTFTETLALRELEEQQQLLAQRHHLEQAILAERLNHEQELKALELEQQLSHEQQLKDRHREHLRQQKNDELAEEIALYQHKQAQWRAVRARMRQEQLETERKLAEQAAEQQRQLREQQALQQQALDLRLQLEQLDHEARLKETELERRKQQANTHQQTSDLLRQEIELLVLEQRRNDLLKQVRAAELRQLPGPEQDAP